MITYSKKLKLFRKKLFIGTYWVLIGIRIKKEHEEKKRSEQEQKDKLFMENLRKTKKISHN
jgi:hypothetical protein